MNLFRSPHHRLICFYVLLAAFCCAPVWAVEYFINQDGSAHLYSSYIMLELLKGNAHFAETFAFNSISVPNSSGHWLMVGLLSIFNPFVVTKIMVTLTFAGFVASIGWLRYRTVGTSGVRTGLLFGAAIAFNWLWLCGFYNFLIGASCFVLTVGLFYGWREKLTISRTVLLAVLFLIAYFSHIISFAILSGSIFLLLFTAPKNNIKHNLIYFFVALLPVIPLLLAYKSISASGGGFFPVWRSLENPFSPVSWFQQLRTADPFILISRRSFPFVSHNSGLFIFFTPFFWILAALFSLALATFKETGKTFFRDRTNVIFGFLLIFSLAAAMLAPDDFGLTNGSILRERLLICGLIFSVPLFRNQNSPILKRIAQLTLLLVVVFQTAALWEFAIRSNSQAHEFLTAQNAVLPDDRLASVIIVEDGRRFNTAPPTMLNNYLGIADQRIVWDNYEIGHYLFPVIAKNAFDKQFVFDLTSSNAYAANNRGQNFEERLSKLETCLLENRGQIKTLLVWGTDPQVEEVLDRMFEPVFANGRVRVFRYK